MATLSVEQVDPAHTIALRHEVLRPHQSLASLAEETGAFGPSLFAIAALIERRVTSCCLAVPAPLPDVDSAAPWRLLGMATRPAARGSGLGAQVVDRILEELRLREATLVWCNARTPAQSLYTRAGFEVIGEPWNDPQIGPHVRMWRMLG